MAGPEQSPEGEGLGPSTVLPVVDGPAFLPSARVTREKSPGSVAFRFLPSSAPPLLHTFPVLSKRQMCHRKYEALVLSCALSTTVHKPDASLLSHKSPRTLREDSQQRIQSEDPNRLDRVGGEGRLLGRCEHFLFTE